jgi:hypothetical protein
MDLSLNPSDKKEPFTVPFYFFAQNKGELKIKGGIAK